jgi:peptidoglycan/xylan/chitin deacetylase (PgdA/CDA1 family)
VNSNILFKKVAVIGVDLEDWYHLDYIENKDRNISMLDGFYKIIELFNQKKILASIFVVGELINFLRMDLKNLSKKKYEIASHGLTHTRPLTMLKEEFIYEIKHTKKLLEEVIDKKVIGFRAPCFSLNRELLNLLFDHDYMYDSSKINFQDHKLYGNIDLSDFNQINEYVYFKLKDKKKKIEFQIPTQKILTKNIPFSGGGYLRVLPELLIKKIIINKEIEKTPIFFYIHPFEFSDKIIDKSKVGIKNFIRMNIGRKNMNKKFSNILDFMINRGWKFTTFKNLYETL